MSIFELIDKGDTLGVRALLEDDPAAAAARDDSGLTPLMHAAYRGRGPVFETIAAVNSPADAWDRLLLGEADGLPAPDAWSPDGFTPLHIAAFARNAEGAAALLTAGADPNVFATAAFAHVTPLGTCAFAGALDVARVLLRNSANPALTEVEGATPLDAARANGDEQLVALLFVSHSHWQIDNVRVALANDPTLANATTDWGGGDWESALGAASHAGNREIAELLLGHGARLDVFAAAMLGLVDVVRAVLDAHPEMRDAKGPHGIPLAAHAKGVVTELFA
ncbi:MAG TPA: ankyrin repeat domain-containing protein [Gaiellaceae bacterium]|nr:ankyrin repeat domain-containing protein [Gaiellaceae bacterium]